MTAAAIANSKAMNAFHGLVLRLTRSTCSDRSTCRPFCTELLPPRLKSARLTLSGPGPARPVTPDNEKRRGAPAPRR
jgi:hypothetical protein